jgi:hypothetical protein
MYVSITIPETRLFQWEITGKKYNTNCDSTCIDLKLRQKRRWKFYAKSKSRGSRWDKCPNWVG